jgi:hypothetical protein
VCLGVHDASREILAEMLNCLRKCKCLRRFMGSLFHRWTVSALLMTFSQIKQELDRFKRKEIYQSKDDIQVKTNLPKEKAFVRSPNLKHLEEIDNEEEKLELNGSQLDSSSEWNMMKPKDKRNLAVPSNSLNFSKILPNFNREKYRQAVKAFENK